MSDIISTDAPLSAEAENLLRALAGTIIPASAEHDRPGADDPVIFADLLISAGPMLEFIGEYLQTLAGATDFLSADPDERVVLAEQLRANQPEAVGLIVSLVGQCYYRDPRVLESLGMAPRPPFPEGYAIDQGDWSLLDPVRQRGRLYRPTS